ncbi:metal-dependent hydrolase [Blastococcus atacamensis]|uniref:metal-dependent hydrolase n=1 Tax=Blastococcus atacamensis TaxID=2070508 RepID=UPI000DE54008|nr:metal-dependent hydrolase [Blastococcus atacamensis]
MASATVVALDQVLAAGPWPTVVEGLLDEPAHLLTAAVLLAALAPGARAPVVAGALTGSVLIDLDHVPLYLWNATPPGDGRPVTHSLATALALVAVARLLRGRARGVLTGAGAGVLLHLVRDLASGPGVPLLWPVTATGAHVPYAVYAGVLAGATGVVVVRWLGSGALSGAGGWRATSGETGRTSRARSRCPCGSAGAPAGRARSRRSAPSAPARRATAPPAGERPASGQEPGGRRG